MVDLHVSIKKYIATYHEEDGKIVCGNSSYRILFDFDEVWNAYEKKVARFIWNGKFHDVEFTGNICPVPKIPKATSCQVGVFADDICTTTSAYIPCAFSVLTQTETPSAENDKYWANEARKYADEAKEARDGVASPYIKNGNWWVGEIDTGVKAQGEDYVLTETDKTEIAELALNLMEQAEDYTYGG